MQYSISRDLPVVGEADVVILGGGPGGVAAAVAAARSGADTLLIERYGYLGGMAVSGEVQPFMPSHAHGRTLDKPLYAEWARRMHDYLPLSDRERFPVPQDMQTGPERLISKDVAMLAAEDLVLESGAKILYHHTLLDALVEDGKITAVVLASKSGLVAVKGQIFIDATGDADLAARTDCEFEQGGPTGHCQPMTLCFKLSGIDRDRTPERHEITEKYLAAKARGETDNQREDVLIFSWFTEDVMHFNSTRVIHRSGTDGVELSDAEIQGRKQARELIAFLRQEIPGYENARIHSIGHHIGIRETRRVRGLAYVDLDDFKAARKYPDAICRCHYNVDIHNPDGQGTEFFHLENDDWYEIPFGSIVAKDIENLMIGCRAISVDHAVHASIRIMPPVISIGQAAGIAAAMAVKTGATCHDLDGQAVREKLKAFGADL